jgi:polysaccharide biosynthesis/export protein
MYKYAIVIISILLTSTSCMHNKIRYIIDSFENKGAVAEYPNPPVDYLIQKKDILSVKISTQNKEINDFFTISGQQFGNFAGGTQGNIFYLYGYTVNDSGNIVLPIVGDIYVEGKSINEIRHIVSKRVDERLNNADVVVNLVSFYLTFLGEFGSQGKLTIMQDNINIIDAVAMAGGITEYGDMKKILLVRKTEKGTKTFRIDLTERSLLLSDKFHLQPNDILIAEPMKNKSFQLGVRDYSLALSTITSTIAIILLVINLKK